MRIINGKKIAQKLLMSLKEKINRMKVKSGLAVVLVGNNPSSLLYVRNKEKAAKKIGVNFELYKFGASVTNQTLISRIKNLNKRKDIHGIIVQLPLPKHLDVNKIISAIDPKKDVDGFRLNSFYVSPVAQAVKIIIDTIENSLKKNSQKFYWKDKRAVVFVNKPLFAAPIIEEMLKKREVIVSVIVKPTFEDLKKYSEQSDLIIIALGKPHVLRKEMIKSGAIVIDIGITKKGKEFLGDFDSSGIKNKKGFYTPVPGGVGPLTVVMLLRNVVIAAKLNK